MANETILVVDGDTRSRKILEVSFKKSGYRVLMTDTISGAVGYLEEESPDLIVSDTDLPDGDGFEFCKRIQENPDWEYTPFLFLTDESSMPRKIEGIEIGADDYLTRPIYIKEVTARVEVLLQKRDRDMLSEGEVEEFEGELSEMTLIDLLQTIDEKGRSGAIEFSRGERSGAITFRDGAVIDANCGKLRGPEAVYRLMLWPGGRFSVRYHDDVPGSDHVDMSIGELILEGVRQIERWDEIVSELPPFEGVYEPDYERLPGFLEAVPEEVGRVVRLFDGYRNLREVVDDSPVGDVTAAEIIERILGEGILEEVSDEPEQGSSSEVQRSHLSSWLESPGDVDREEHRSPGDASAAPSDDPHETQEIERDDLATALSDELDEEERADQTEPAPEQTEGAPDAFGEEGLDPSESGPRYMPDEREETKRGVAEVDEEPEPVDETLDDLEEAERKRREEEAKRLVEQKHESGEQPAAPADDTPAGDVERRRAEGDDAPQIPGATKTPSGSQTSPAAESVSGEQPAAAGQRDTTGRPASEEAPDRGRTDTPRAHPATGEASGQQEAASERSREKTQSGLGETALEQDGESEVPVSFETVGDGEQESASPKSFADEQPAESESTAPESPGQSMTEDAAEAVRQSAREALEDAAFEADDWSEETDDRDVGGESPDEDRERETPSREERTADEGVGGGPQEPPAEATERGESTELPSEEPAEARDAARTPESDEETGGETDESEGAPSDDIERVSNNGEVVRTEYDLGGPGEGGDQPSPSETLGGGSGTPGPADETIESDDTLEGVSRDRQSEDDVVAERSVESAPSDDTLDGFSGVSGEVTVEEDAARDVPQGEKRSGPEEEPTDEGLNWEEEPTARDFDWASEDEDVSEPELGESLDETTDESSEDSSAPSVRIESEAFAASEEDTAVSADETAEQQVETTSGERKAAEVESPGGRGSREAPPSTSDESVDTEEERAAPSDETPKVAGEEEDLDDLTDSAGEASFFDEEEQEETYDWDYDEDVDSGGSGGTWTIVLILFVVGGVGGVAYVLGPFSSGGDTDSGQEGASGAVATSDEPESAGSGEESEDPSPDEEKKPAEREVEEPEPAVESEKEAQTVSRETAAAVGERAKRRSRILGGDDPYLSAAARGDAGDVGTEQDAGAPKAQQKVAAKQTESGGGGPSGSPSEGSQETSAASSGASGGGGGGGVSAQVRRVERLIQQGRLSEARSKLREVNQQAPGRSDVANLYLDLASQLQINGSVEQAKSAYRSYLDVQPEGPRAEEVRSILDRL